MCLTFCNKTTKYLCTSKFSWPKSKTQSVQFQKKERREKGRTEVFWFNLAKLYPDRSYKVWESLCLWYPPTGSGMQAGKACRVEGKRHEKGELRTGSNSSPAHTDCQFFT